jgi:hypothetical protein
LAAVVGLALGEMQSHAAVLIDRYRVDLRAQPPTRASQSLLGAVFLGAPAAW